MKAGLVGGLGVGSGFCLGSKYSGSGRFTTLPTPFSLPGSWKSLPTRLCVIFVAVSRQ